MDAIDRLLQLMEREGSAWYGRERVTQLAHSLQTARLAEGEGAPPALVAAALLHDVGHLLAKDRPALGEQREVDDRHEFIAGGYLERIFGPDVAQPVRLHVEAKRYLCAVDPDYHATLSPASVRSLGLQGGICRPEQAEAFRGQPYAEDAIRLRRWDDMAKDPDAKTPPLETYAALLRGLAL